MKREREEKNKIIANLMTQLKTLQPNSPAGVGGIFPC